MSKDKQNIDSNRDVTLDGSDQFAVRQEKLNRLRENGLDPFRANWEQSHTSSEAQALLPEEMEEGPEVSVAGRIVAFRLMGKASFIKILDRKGRIQSYVRRDEIGEEEYASFKKLDLGDFIGIKGKLFELKPVKLQLGQKNTVFYLKPFDPCQKNGMGSQIMNKFIVKDIWI